MPSPSASASSSSFTSPYSNWTAKFIPLLSSSFSKMPSSTLSTQIELSILLLRGQRVMLDFQLAELYQIDNRVLKQAVRRNLQRFPEDFMFELSSDEISNLRSQLVISSSHGGSRHGYFASTEQGVAMLSTALTSGRAIQVNISIMRALVHLRELLLTHADLALRLENMEKKYDGQFRVVFDAIRQLMTSPSKPTQEMGFHKLEKPKTVRKSKTSEA
jgi:ORF6N domain